MKKNWIQQATKQMKLKGTLGSFTSAAKKRSQTVNQLAKSIRKNPSKYTSGMSKKANFALTMQKIRRKK